jgi:hypothetical protein
METEQQRAMTWMMGRDTGASSKSIVAVMLGGNPCQASYPYDSYDFGRCYRLLTLIPEWRRRIGEMAAAGHVWAAIAGAWDELERLYHHDQAIREQVQFLSRKKQQAADWKFYGRIKELELQGLLADPTIEVDVRPDGKSWSSWRRKAA